MSPTDISTVILWIYLHRFSLPTMSSAVIVALVTFATIYVILQVLLRATQSKSEPRLLSAAVPFLGPAVGIARHKVNYLVNLRKCYALPIQTLRMPFQRIYVVNASHLIQAVQNKINLPTFVPTLLDFGMLFSGLTKSSKATLVQAYGIHGNGFTKSVHKHLSSGSGLQAATRTAVDRMAASVPNNLVTQGSVGLYDALRHQLMLALTGAIYGPENPYDDPATQASWLEFVPGINHLLYSPFPSLTARKALQARARVIGAFQKYFETGGHTQAFTMIPEMFKVNMAHGLCAAEAAKLEMATSLAMLSSGAISAFWLMFHIVSNPDSLRQCRQEILNLVTKEAATATGVAKLVDLSDIKQKCPTLIAMWQETLRYHSTVINIKKVQNDTTLAEQYYLKKDGIVMIPGTAVHHDTDTWGSNASQFDQTRFLAPEGRKKLSNTTAFRPFGAGTTMCPGRHFSTNAILSLTVMILLQFDIEVVEGVWRMPTKKNADMWNAMPKPDWDIPVRITKRSDTSTEWKFVWGSGSIADTK
ncbi:cytochrome P450 [Bimuria novae-zelandiae CBS 107.79]|uniref:Cytochrome P450 n=1 Tax=Bimuria novae-zelandiae CBS 107.79 TaxID=1447943 RepID=A0A6A5VMM3_9PLEO|nr:cytochrome P450 [Bimuria novae-zelandiae CBS 107.79]